MTARFNTEIEGLRRQIAEARAALARPVGSGDLAVPDVMEFVLSDRYLNRPWLYPKQATLLKVMFLQTESLTTYDEAVLADWTSEFVLHPPEEGEMRPELYYEGHRGLAPDVLDRAAHLQATGHRWFPEVVCAVGRRGGKNYLGALAASYVLWTVLGRGNPQEFFEMDQDKQILTHVFGPNLTHVKNNSWLDIVNVIVSGPCFAPYLDDVRSDELVLKTPFDLERTGRPRDGSIVVAARQTTVTAGRGPAAILQVFDEMAFVTPATANASADAVYEASKPAMDQFREFGFLFEASSPAQQTGKFYENHRNGLAVDAERGQAMYPGILSVQLPSWGPYEDWQLAHTLRPVPEEIARQRPGHRAEGMAYFPRIRRPIQQYDDRMRAEERKNPAEFAVERLAHWRTVAEAYFNPADITAMFDPYQGQPLLMRSEGAIGRIYFAHADPAASRDNFAWMIAHVEGPDPRGLYHLVVDLLRVWKPSDGPGHRIPHEEVYETIRDDLRAFMPEYVSFDDGAESMVQRLEAYVRDAPLARRVTIDRHHATRATNETVASFLREALATRRVHAPHDRLLEDELRFMVERGGRPDHPTTGPVITKDAADALMVLCHHLLGDTSAGVHDALGALNLGATVPGPASPTDAALFDRISAIGRRQPRGGDPWPPSRVLQPPRLEPGRAEAARQGPAPAARFGVGAGR